MKLCVEESTFLTEENKLTDTKTLCHGAWNYIINKVTKSKCVHNQKHTREGNAQEKQKNSSVCIQKRGNQEVENKNRVTRHR